MTFLYEMTVRVPSCVPLQIFTCFEALYDLEAAFGHHALLKQRIERV